MAPRRKNRKATWRKVKQGAKSMGDNPEDCPVCSRAFDLTVQRPHTLPCGHTFCTLCINGLNAQHQVTCPTCCVKHTVPEAGHFAINYTLEAIIKRLRDTVVTSTSLPPCAGKGAGKAGTPGQKGAAGQRSSVHSILQEQQAKVLATITTFQEVESKLDLQETNVKGWLAQQRQREDKLQAVINDSRSARVLLNQEKSQLIAKKKQVQQEKEQLCAVLETVRKLMEEDASITDDDAIRCIEDAEQKIEGWQEIVSDVYTGTTARNVRGAISASVKVFNSVHAVLETPHVPTSAAGSECNLQAAPASTIMDRVTLPTLTLKAEDLRTLTEPIRSLVEAGLVFATHKTEDRSRYARISLEDGRLYLHSLQNQILPLGTATLQMDEVVPAMPPCLVFLDLAWPGNALHRVLIRLSTNTPLGQQFVLLCTGQQGPSYVNTKLFEVVGKGQPGEWVVGGDHENNDGTGRATLLPDLDKGEYRESGRAGAVCRVWYVGEDDESDRNDEESDRNYDESNWNAQFCIYTTDQQDGAVARFVFGEVVDGLEGVAAAAQHSPINEVTVVDCGVVLWQ